MKFVFCFGSRLREKYRGSARNEIYNLNSDKNAMYLVSLLQLEAIRARRSRLEALTVAMRSQPLDRHGDVTDNRNPRFSASKMRRQQQPNNSAGIRLEPL